MEEIEDILALKHNPATDTFIMNSVNGDQDEIEATIMLGHFTSSKRQRLIKNMFPDSGASICLAGTHHLAEFKTSTKELTPCNKQVSVVGGGTFPCLGYINAEFIVDGTATK